MALTKDRDTVRRAGEQLSLPVAAGVRVFAGAMVAVVATFARPAGNGRVVGIAQEQVDNRDGTDGALRIEVRRGTYLLENSAGADAITLDDYGLEAYAVDDQTVAKTDGGGARQVAGIVRDVDASGVWVEF
ncbi:Phage protein [plant metagenome]|uniref:Phage protein n=1 Tax=plant metagenome TaxID=1297885 RepID=A0A484TCX5_9ZZZZ